MIAKEIKKWTEKDRKPISPHAEIKRQKSCRITLNKRTFIPVDKPIFAVIALVNLKVF